MFLYIQKLRASIALMYSARFTHKFRTCIMNEKRTQSIILRLTEKEKEMLVFLAKRHDMNISSYVRNMSLKGSVVTKTDIQTVIELKRIGNNLNQIAKQINLIPHEDNIKIHLQEIHDSLNMISEITKKLV